MNPSSDAHSRSLEVAPSEPSPAASESAPFPANWQTALDALITSRLSLFQLESKEALVKAARSLIFITAGALAILFAWGLILVGIIQLIHLSTQWPWHWVALAAGGLHLLIALILVNLAKPSNKSAFPVTRAEFQKDREWLHQVLKTKKSSD